MIFPFSDDVPSRRTPVVTIAIIAINTLALLAVNGLSSLDRQRFVLDHGFIPARIAQLKNKQPIEVDIDRLAIHPHLEAPVQIREHHRLQPSAPAVWLSLVTSLFLHGGWMHLIGNMWFFWIFGDNVEDRLGHATFAAFYLIGGVLANLCHWFSEPASTIPVIGASGAVAAILGAYIVTWPFARIRCIVVLIIFVTMIELPAMLVLGFWFLTQLLEATQQVRVGIDGGVAFWAHVGGFVAGMVAMPIFRGPGPPRQVRVAEPPT